MAKTGACNICRFIMAWCISLLVLPICIPNCGFWYMILMFFVGCIGVISDPKGIEEKLKELSVGSRFLHQDVIQDWVRVEGLYDGSAHELLSICLDEIIGYCLIVFFCSRVDWCFPFKSVVFFAGGSMTVDRGVLGHVITVVLSVWPSLYSDARWAGLTCCLELYDKVIVFWQRVEMTWISMCSIGRALVIHQWDICTMLGRRKGIIIWSWGVWRMPIIVSTINILGPHSLEWR